MAAAPEFLRDLDNRVDPQVAVARRSRADAVGLVGHPNEQRVGIGVRIDRDGAHSERPWLSG